MPKRIRVLHLAKDPVDAQPFQGYLQDSSVGYHIDTVGSLGEGLRRLSDESFDLILLSLDLSGSLWIKNFRKIHSHAAEVPVIVLSSLRDEKMALQAVHEGAQDYLIEADITPLALVRSIDYAIERNKAQRKVVYLNRLLGSIREINRLVVEEHESETLLARACEILCGAAGFDMVWIGLIGPEHARVIPVAASGLPMEWLRQQTVTWDDSSTGKGPSGSAIRTKHALRLRKHRQ